MRDCELSSLTQPASPRRRFVRLRTAMRASYVPKRCAGLRMLSTCNRTRSTSSARHLDPCGVGQNDNQRQMKSPDAGCTARGSADFLSGRYRARVLVIELEIAARATGFKTGTRQEVAPPPSPSPDALPFVNGIRVPTLADQRPRMPPLFTLRLGWPMNGSKGVDIPDVVGMPRFELGASSSRCGSYQARSSTSTQPIFWPLRVGA